MIDLDWLNTTKERDPNFAGSIHEIMGFDDVLCPTCGAHLHRGICLNACHLSPESRQRFSKIMGCVSERRAQGAREEGT